MATAKFQYQFNPNEYINYMGTDEEYWPDSGPVVVPELHTPRVSAYDLDALELASNGKVVFTTGKDKKALEVSAVGLTDPQQIDTTVLDSGTRKLQLKSDVGTLFACDSIDQTASQKFVASIGVPDPADPTFHQVATDARMVIGTGVLDASDNILSGGFFETTEDSFKLRHDDASITSTSGVESSIRYEAAVSHEFFSGPTAKTQALGTGAVEIRSDKVIIRKDVDLVGSINSSATNLDMLNVEDQILELAYTDPASENANKDSLLAGGKAGLTINTVPGSYADDKEYLGRFVDSAGAKLFVDDTTQTIRVDKARDAGIFTKEMAFYIAQGAKNAGERTNTSRLTEPYWNVTGGSFHLSHVVPDGNAKAKKFTLGFRITDDGSMEMVRLTRNLLWDTTANTYQVDAQNAPIARVMSRYVAP